MGRSVLQASVTDRGLVLDPRTKLLLLLNMAIFVLGSAGGERVLALTPLFCAMPAVLLLSAKKWKTAITYIILFSVSYWGYAVFGDITTGFLHYFLLGCSGILARFLPSIMMGGYLVSTTTVSEFTAAMLRMKLSEKIIIPLSVMFRFFPTVFDEAASINAAMKMRGIHLGGRNAGGILEYRIVPLMTCCVKIGEELSAAALTRGLGGDVRRTNICNIGFKVQDIIFIMISLVPYVLWILDIVGI